MTDHGHLALPAALLALLALAGCAGSGDAGREPVGDPASIEADYFHERWEGGGSTLRLRTLDGAFVSDNRAEVPAGRHELLYDYEITESCDPTAGCNARRYSGRLAVELAGGRAYRLKAERGESAVRVWLEDEASGEAVASGLEDEDRLQQVGVSNAAWASLCRDAERGDPIALRAIGLYYWRGWWPARRDVTRAYQWLTLGARANDADAARFRVTLAAEMTPAEIARGLSLAAAWKPGSCATESRLAASS